MPNKYSKTLKGEDFSSPKRKKQKSRRKLQSRNYLKKERSRHVKITLLLVLIVIVVVAVVYFLLFSHRFDIKETKINKLADYQLITEQEIKDEINSLKQEKRLLIFSQENIFSFNSRKLGQILEKDLRISEFKINKEMPNKIVVNLKETKPVALLISFGNYQDYFLNKEGNVIYSAIKREDDNFTTLEEVEENNIEEMAIIEDKESEKEDQEEKLPIFYDYTEINLNEPDYTSFLKNVLNFINNPIFEKQEINIELIKITEDGNIFDAKIDTSKGWYILINSEADFKEQSNNLSLVLTQGLKDKQKLEHIDLRFGDRIFYKLEQEKEKEY